MNLGSRESWNISTVDLVRDQVQKELQEKEENTTTEDMFHYCFERIMHRGSFEGDFKDLRSFFYILHLIELQCAHQKLRDSQVKKIIYFAKLILQRNKVKPAKSRLSHLHRELHTSIALYHSTKGENLNAAWQLGMADFLSKGSGKGEADFDSLMVSAQTLYDQGFRQSAWELLRDVDLSQKDSKTQIKVRSFQIWHFFYLGDYKTAAKLVSSASRRFPKGSPEYLEIEWLGMLGKTFISRDPKPLVQAAKKKKGGHHTPKNMVTSFLWAYALSSKSALKNLPSSEVIRKSFPQQCKASRPYGATLKCLRLLEKVYTTDVDITEKLAEVGKILPYMARIRDMDHRLLFLAALVRWLHRSKQLSFTLTLLQEYHLQCLRLTQGRQRDVFGVLADVAGRVTQVNVKNQSVSEKPPTTLSKVPLLSEFGGLDETTTTGLRPAL